MVVIPGMTISGCDGTWGTYNTLQKAISAWAYSFGYNIPSGQLGYWSSDENILHFCMNVANGNLIIKP